MPGSVGLNLQRNNEEYFIKSVFMRRDGLRYTGQTAAQKATSNAITIAHIDDIVEIPAKSLIGYYSYLTGEVADTILPKTRKRDDLDAPTQQVPYPREIEIIGSTAVDLESFESPEALVSSEGSSSNLETVSRKSFEKKRSDKGRSIDTEKLISVLERHFSESMFVELCTTLGVDYEYLMGDSRAEKIRWLVLFCKERKLTWKLLTKAHVLYQKQ